MRAPRVRIPGSQPRGYRFEDIIGLWIVVWQRASVSLTLGETKRALSHEHGRHRALPGTGGDCRNTGRRGP